MRGLRFPNDLRGIFVVSESNELRMSQVVSAGPLQELDLRDYLRTQPNTFLHFLRSKPLTPPASGQLRKVSERAFGRLQVFNPFEDLASCCRDQASPHSGCVNEVLSTVEAHHEGIDAQWLGMYPPTTNSCPRLIRYLLQSPVR